MNIKQVLVLRQKFPTGKNQEESKLRTGKYVAQGAHAASKVFFDNIIEMNLEGDKGTMLISITKEMFHWIRGNHKKAVVYVLNEEQLLEIFEKAKASGLPTAIITDSGLTEFNGVPTKTAISIGPANADDIDEITGALPLF